LDVYPSDSEDAALISEIQTLHQFAAAKPSVTTYKRLIESLLKSIGHYRIKEHQQREDYEEMKRRELASASSELEAFEAQYRELKNTAEERQIKLDHSKMDI